MQELKGLSFIGMPGAGKTPVGEACAKRLGYNFLDMDRWLESHEGGKSTAQIVAEKSWEYVLDLEATCVHSLHQQIRPVVFAPSGSVIYADNTVRDELRASTLVIMLDTPVESIQQRLSQRDGSRAIKGLDRLGGLENLFNERRPKYLDWADVVLDCKGRSLSNTVDQAIATYHEQIG